MSGCPSCGAAFASEQDLRFVKIDAKQPWLTLKSPKMFYLTGCAACGAIVGTGVAGATGSSSTQEGRTGLHCPNCETAVTSSEDVRFDDVHVQQSGLFSDPRRFYVTECAHCDYTLGSGVSGTTLD